MHCKHVNAKNKPCASRPLAQGDYCWFHDPKRKTDRQAAQRRGGRNNAVKVESPMSPLINAKPSSISEFLVTIINEVREGSLDIRVANCLGVLTGHLARIYEVAEYEERLAALEADVLERLKSPIHPITK